MDDEAMICVAVADWNERGFDAFARIAGARSGGGVTCR